MQSDNKLQLNMYSLTKLMQLQLFAVSHF